MSSISSTAELGCSVESPWAVFADHARRSVIALRGFGVYRSRWLRPWMAYCVSPLTNRISRRRTQRFNNFNARVGECDLCAFANVFADYPASLLRSAVTNVDLIVDLGANVGAFSLLMRTMAPQARIVAVEPEAANVAFLRAQPFADKIEIHQAAVGPHEGTGRLIRGINSVTHHIDLASSGDAGELVATVTLDALCTEPALVKMDIEGGELAILQRGLPDTVRYLVLEWHHPGTPADFVPGDWRHIATDLHGATTWWLAR